MLDSMKLDPFIHACKSMSGHAKVFGLSLPC